MKSQDNETQWKLYADNTETWNAMLEACKNAQKSIVLEQFIFVVDDMTQKLIDICEERVQHGVRVRFIWDAAGSFSFFGSNILEELKKKGIELVFFKTLLPNFLTVHDYRSWYLRNHRRTLVIDDEIGFTGSICMSEKLMPWKDTTIELRGMVVHDMSKAFDRMWDRAHKKKLPHISGDPSRDHEFRYITNNPLPRNRFLYNTTIEAIRNARKYIYITTPYFVPTRRLARVLRLAAHRGVDVEILIPEHTDHPLVDLGARTYFSTLLASGVRIFTYTGTMLHKKTIVIDGDWSSIGTFNLDRASLLYNFEASLVTSNSKCAEELAAHFVHDKETSTEILYTDWKRRYWVEKCAGLFIRLFRQFL